MAVDIIVPPLSQTMDTVVVVEWLKAVGDEVVQGEPLFVIETDKAHLEIEAPASGILQQILAEPGTEVKVRSRIGVVASSGEAVPEQADLLESSHLEASGPDRMAPSAEPHPLPRANGPGGESLPLERRQRVFASPRARRLARQEGVSLAEVQATGPQQMIVERDIRAYLATREAAASAGIRWMDLPPTRRTIARRMAESHRAAAAVTLMREVDTTELVRLRQQILEELSEGDPRPTYTDFLLTVVARQLKHHPYVNATNDGERIGLSEEVHIAVAVDTERGLVAPVVRNADRKRLLPIAQERAELTQRALNGSITPEELSGGTFTITNLGPLGIDAFTPIINPPQAAILGVGRIHPGPAVHGGELCIRQLMYLSLTFDHCIVDGAPAARFLQDVVRMIEKPHLIWL